MKPSQISKIRRQLQWSLLAVIGCSWASSWLGTVETQELASKSVIKSTKRGSQLSLPTRSTELNPIVPSELKPEKEIEILLKDPTMTNKWGHIITESERAWKISQGSRDVIVAVIDTGVDVNHKDLNKNLWVNKGESGLDKNGKDKATNGFDDDNNGFVDDVHGWNFVDNSKDISDRHGHGTHIAGIIGAQGTNGKGVKGVAPKVSLMILRYYDVKSSGIDNLKNTVRAIDYATKMGANIINYSGGGTDPSPEEKTAIARANEKGILVVAAAGNERSNSDLAGYYPANYGLPNIISVTAFDKERKVLPSSNYGAKTVDLAAPGNQIFSTVPGGKYGTMSGTSQATAFVTGVAALLIANNAELRTPERLTKYLLQTGDEDESLNGKTRYKRRLNSYKALVIKDADESLNGVKLVNARNLKSKNFSIDPSSTALLPESLDVSTSREELLSRQTHAILKHLYEKSKPGTSLTEDHSYSSVP